MPNQPSPCLSRQVKATDGGSPPLSSHVRLHISWVARPGPSSEPLAFDEPHFNFAVMETDPVNHMVGVISIEMGPSQVWFNITGEAQRLHPHKGVRSAHPGSLGFQGKLRDIWVMVKHPVRIHGLVGSYRQPRLCLPAEPTVPPGS